MRLFIIYVASLLLLFTPLAASIPTYQHQHTSWYGTVGSGAYHYIKESYFNYALFVLMNRNFNKLRFFNLIDQWNKYLLNNLKLIILIIFMISIICYFNFELYFFKMFISFLIFHFIFNKFKYSPGWG